MKKFVSTCMVLALALTITGCNTKGPTSSTSNKTIKKVGFSVLTMNNPFFVKMRDEAKADLAKHGIQMIEADPQLDPGKQMSAVENFINEGVDAIMLDPIDGNAIMPAIKEANNKGIPVFTLDSNASGGNIVSFIGTDNVQAGTIIGEYIAKRLNGKGNVAIIDYPLATSCLDRVKGLKDVLTKYPDIKIVAEQKGGIVTDGLAVAETWMNQLTNLDGIFAINDPNGLGALTSVEKAKRQDHIFVTSVDGSQEVYDAMKGGRNYGATAAQFPDKMAKMTVDNMIKWSKGQKVAKTTLIPTELITKDSLPQ